MMDMNAYMVKNIIGDSQRFISPFSKTMWLLYIHKKKMK